MKIKIIKKLIRDFFKKNIIQNTGRDKIEQLSELNTAIQRDEDIEAFVRLAQFTLHAVLNQTCWTVIKCSKELISL